jgi:hypothetical protein
MGDLMGDFLQSPQPMHKTNKKEDKPTHKILQNIIAADLPMRNASPLPMISSQPFIVSPQPVTLINMPQVPNFLDNSPLPQAMPFILTTNPQNYQQNLFGSATQKKDNSIPLATPVWNHEPVKNDQSFKQDEFVLLYPDIMGNVVQTHVLPAYHSPVPFHIVGRSSSPHVQIASNFQVQHQPMNLQKVSLENRMLHLNNQPNVSSPRSNSDSNTPTHSPNNLNAVKYESIQRGSSLHLMKSNFAESSNAEIHAVNDKKASLPSKSRRKRSALRSDLIFCGLYTDPNTENNCTNRRPANYEPPEEINEGDDGEEDEEEIEEHKETQNERISNNSSIAIADSASSNPSLLASSLSEHGTTPIQTQAEDNLLSRIRVWIDVERKTFFDCTCGKRMLL